MSGELNDRTAAELAELEQLGARLAAKPAPLAANPASR
jgi:uncharacterized small protein (DUF1192 family)